MFSNGEPMFNDVELTFSNVELIFNDAEHNLSWRSISRPSSKFQGLTTASQSSSVPMYETVLIVSSASSEGDA